MNTEPSSTTEAVPGRNPDRAAPIFIVGPDRSGTTLIYAILASHPNISMVRRTNMWRYFHDRYGDLSDAGNLDRCLDAMLRYQRLTHLEPDGERIKREFLQGEPTYGRLFALFHEHNAERAGKTRWGDKSLHTEHYADRVFAAYPDATILHMVRDPRDRYASAKKRHGQDLSRVGAATGRWLESTRIGRRNAARWPGRYLVIRYEDLAREPESTTREICGVIGEPFVPEMLAMGGAGDHAGRGNSSFGDVETNAISTRAIGRYRQVLTPSEIAFVELVARRTMTRAGYQREGSGLRGVDRVRFDVWDLPFQLARMAGWILTERRHRRRGVEVPEGRILEEPEDTEDERDGG